MDKKKNESMLFAMRMLYGGPSRIPGVAVHDPQHTGSKKHVGKVVLKRRKRNKLARANRRKNR